MTYTIKYVNFTLRALFQKSRPLMAVHALSVLYGSYAHVISTYAFVMNGLETACTFIQHLQSNNCNVFMAHTRVVP